MYRAESNLDILISFGESNQRIELERSIEIALFLCCSYKSYAESQKDQEEISPADLTPWEEKADGQRLFRDEQV